MNNLAVTVPKQVGGFTAFLHTVPAVVTFLIALGLFLVLAKSERLGGLQFRHVLMALVFGILASAVIPKTWTAQLNTLTTTSHRITAAGIFFAIIVIEFVMIIRDRRRAGGGPE